MPKTAIGAVAFLLSCLPLGAASAADSCIWIRNISDFRAAHDEKSLTIDDTPLHKVSVTLAARCVGLRFANAIAVRSVGDQYCLQSGDKISFNDGGVPRACLIDKIERIAPPAN